MEWSLVPLAMVVGCSLTTKLDGFSAGPDGPTTTDGGASSGDDAAVETDAGGDGAAIDAASKYAFLDAFTRDDTTVGRA